MKTALLLASKLALYSALAIAPLHDARAEKTVPYDTIPGWDIAAYFPEGGDASDSCLASSYYPSSDTSIHIMITVDQQAFFGLSSPTIGQNLTNGKEYAFNVFSNGKFYNTIKMGVKNNLASTTVNVDGLQMLAAARSIGFETGLLSFGNFNLKNSSAAIAKVKECVAVLQHSKKFQSQEPQETTPQVQEPMAADPIVDGARSF